MIHRLIFRQEVMTLVRHTIHLGGHSYKILIEIAIIMPDDVAEEKVKALQSLGADVERVRPASIVDKKQVSFHFPNSQKHAY